MVELTFSVDVPAKEDGSGRKYFQPDLDLRCRSIESNSSVNKQRN